MHVSMDQDLLMINLNATALITAETQTVEEALARSIMHLTLQIRQLLSNQVVTCAITTVVSFKLKKVNLIIRLIINFFKETVDRFDALPRDFAMKQINNAVVTRNFNLTYIENDNTVVVSYSFNF